MSPRHSDEQSKPKVALTPDSEGVCDFWIPKSDLQHAAVAFNFPSSTVPAKSQGAEKACSTVHEQSDGQSERMPLIWVFSTRSGATRISGRVSIESLGEWR